MIYCVSDIHGELDKFERLLTLTQFSENDHLYVIGDAIDRCAMGVDILRLIMDTSNMTMLLAITSRCASPLSDHIMSSVLVSFGGKTAAHPPIGSCSTIGHLTSAT